MRKHLIPLFLTTLLFGSCDELKKRVQEKQATLPEIPEIIEQEVVVPSDPFRKNFTKTFSGSIAEKEQIRLTLIRKGAELSGNIRYGNQAPKVITGSIQDEVISLKERNTEGKEVAVFQGQFGSMHELRGFRQKNGEKMGFYVYDEAEKDISALESEGPKGNASLSQLLSRHNLHLQDTVILTKGTNSKEFYLALTNRAAQNWNSNGDYYIIARSGGNYILSDTLPYREIYARGESTMKGYESQGNIMFSRQYWTSGDGSMERTVWTDLINGKICAKSVFQKSQPILDFGNWTSANGQLLRVTPKGSQAANEFKEFQVSYGKDNFRSEKDLGGRCSISYDKDNLYVKGRIRDNTIVWGEGLGTDHMEIWLADGANKLQQLLVNVTEGENGRRILLTTTYPNNGKKLILEGNAERITGGYLMDFAIPLRWINIQPSEGQILPFTISISDTDQEGGSQETLMSSSNLEYAKLSSFGKAVFVDHYGNVPITKSLFETH